LPPPASIFAQHSLHLFFYLSRDDHRFLILLSVRPLSKVRAIFYHLLPPKCFRNLPIASSSVTVQAGDGHWNPPQFQLGQSSTCTFRYSIVSHLKYHLSVSSMVQGLSLTMRLGYCHLLSSSSFFSLDHLAPVVDMCPHPQILFPQHE